MAEKSVLAGGYAVRVIDLIEADGVTKSSILVVFSSHTHEPADS